MNLRVDESRAVGHLMDLLSVPGGSGSEGPVAALVCEKLRAAGVPAEWMKHDRAHERIRRAFGPAAPSFEVGNLIVKIPGTRPGARRLGLAHMDTVPLCRGARPVRRGNFIRPAGKTGLGADNRVGVAAWVTMIETLVREWRPHPPLTIVFTIAEEIGLYGAKFLRWSELGRPAMAFNIDCGEADRIVIGAIGARNWEAHVHGWSSHAGIRPEEGVSAILIASRAIERAAARGYFGRIVQGRRKGTANAGVIRGGEATNEVTQYVYVRGECRSHHPNFLEAIVRQWRRAFEEAARDVRNVEGRTGRVEFRAISDYPSFRLPKNHPAVRFALAAMRAVGIKAETGILDGGLDANPLNAAGVPTITFGAGQHRAHSLDEYVNIREYLAGCQLALQLATAPD